MIQCEDCELFLRGGDGSPKLLCDPFSNIKEPECLQKHQAIKLSLLAQYHQATLEMYQRLAPLQEKMMRHVEREIEDTEDADRWKYERLDGDNEDDDDDDPFRV